MLRWRSHYLGNGYLLYSRCSWDENSNAQIPECPNTLNTRASRARKTRAVKANHRDPGRCESPRGTHESPAPLPFMASRPRPPHAPPTSTDDEWISNELWGGNPFVCGGPQGPTALVADLICPSFPREERDTRRTSRSKYHSIVRLTLCRHSAGALWPRRPSGLLRGGRGPALVMDKLVRWSNAKGEMTVLGDVKRAESNKLEDYDIEGGKGIRHRRG